MLYLASDKALNINGQTLHIEKGRVAIYSKPVEVRTIYKMEAGRMWTLDGLEEGVPKTLLLGYVDPAPAEAHK